MERSCLNGIWSDVLNIVENFIKYHHGKFLAPAPILQTVRRRRTVAAAQRVSHNIPARRLRRKTALHLPANSDLRSELLAMRRKTAPTAARLMSGHRGAYAKAHPRVFPYGCPSKATSAPRCGIRMCALP
jgi:hypothetical protein